MAHARCSASAAYRWTECAASVAEGAKYPETSSVHADAGTEAHKEAANCLEEWEDSDDPAVRMYVDYVESLRGKAYVEVKLDRGLTKLHPDLGGTADAVVLHEGGELIEVIDFKYGENIGVEVEDNLQLQIYAIGALLALDLRTPRVKVTIVQPRHQFMEPVRSWEFDTLDLIATMDLIAKAAEATRSKTPQYRAGPWCQFCPAAALCPENTRNAHALIEFEPIENPELVGKALDMLPGLKEKIKQLDKLAYRMALNNNPPKGHKLVEKRATRKWVDDKALPQAFYKEVPMTPPEVEKAIGKKEFKAYADLVVKQSSGYTLVPEGDKRPAISTAIQFDVIENDTPNALDFED